MDEVNRTVECKHCRARLDPFEAILYLAEDQEAHERYVKDLNRRKEIAEREHKEYVPRSRAMKIIDKQVDKNNSSLYKAYPTCPACKEPFKIEEIAKEWRVDALAEKQVRKRIRESGGK